MVTSSDFSGLLNRRFLQNLLPVPATNQLQIGHRVPDFELLDMISGQPIRLSSYRGDRPVVLALTRIFTEKQYCPFCYPHIKALNDNYEAFVRRGTEILMITSTDENQSRMIARDLGLKMPLLSDSTCGIFRVYNLGQALGAPLPGQFLLDKRGVLQYKHLFSFFDHNASIETLLTAVDQLKP
ncbi:MAG: redoxin domain-containing protein [Oscillatoriales cyanobacterium RM2_1_1]|nr:redoxin domain-containing protein [Oscillatoriales cyanobacterium RM2_1_1]